MLLPSCVVNFYNAGVVTRDRRIVLEQTLFITFHRNLRIKLNRGHTYINLELQVYTALRSPIGFTIPAPNCNFSTLDVGGCRLPHLNE
jgi:hypothetical protein